MAETRSDADNAFDTFIETYAVKYEKAAACLAKDRETLLAFYDFPAEHWKHLRTTNPIESTFATVRHRTVRSKGCLSNKTALAMVFKLTQGAQNSWRRLDGHNQLPKLIVGVIPTVIDQNPCAHLRMPRDMIFHGWSMRLFQAWQHSATMSS